MARVVRKVSNRNVSGQKRQTNIFKNKWFWVVSAVVLVVLGIIIAVVITNNNSKNENDYANTVDYFETNEEVDFNVSTYSALANYTNVNYVDPQTGENLHKTNVFVFMYDLKSFYPIKDLNKDEDGNDLYNENHKKILEKLVDLQKAIDAAKEDGLDVELLIINESAGNNFNMQLNTQFGGTGQAEYSYMFSYIQNGELNKEEIEIGGYDYSLFSTNLNNMITTIIPQTINYVKGGLESK